MRSVLPFVVACTLVSTLPAQEDAGTLAPRLTQAIELADGTALTIRYAARPWRDGGTPGTLGTAAVRGGLKVGGRIVPEGEYTLAVGTGPQPRLVFADGKRGAALELALRPSAEHARRLEIVLTAGDQDGHGVLRFAFGDHAGREAITTPDPEALREATARLRDGARLETARIEVQAILDQTELYMIQNPGPVPSWVDLLRKDARGHSYIHGDAPKEDPWGHAYVITADPDYPNKPFVLSFGPDGVEGTADDISNKTLRKKRTGSAPSSRPSKKR